MFLSKRHSKCIKYIPPPFTYNKTRNNNPGIESSYQNNAFGRTGKNTLRQTIQRVAQKVPTKTIICKLPSATTINGGTRGSYKKTLSVITSRHLLLII